MLTTSKLSQPFSAEDGVTFLRGAIVAAGSHRPGAVPIGIRLVTSHLGGRHHHFHNSDTFGPHSQTARCFRNCPFGCADLRMARPAAIHHDSGRLPPIRLQGVYACMRDQKI